jgi:hypothetical protein
MGLGGRGLVGLRTIASALGTQHKHVITSASEQAQVDLLVAMSETDVVYGAEISFVSARVRGASAIVVTPSVRYRQRDGGRSGMHVVAAFVDERRSQRWVGRRCLWANPIVRWGAKPNRSG